MTTTSIGSGREKSKSVYQNARHVIPGGVNSPVRSYFDVGIPPLVAMQGLGDQILDVDGNWYTDFCMSWGALILGHAHPYVVAAAQQRVALGSSFGALVPEEERLASTIIASMPWLEQLRFVSSGTEATMSALRLARAVTGKKKIVKFIGNYHGHHDQLLIQAGSGVSNLGPTASSKGVLPDMIQYTLCLPYNDPHALTRVLETEKDIAAVIFEPIAGNMGVVPPTPAFLNALTQGTKASGALLIADEVITGFRIGLGGAQTLYQFEADLTCLGKIIGGGFPAAAFGGKRQIMEELAPLGGVYQAGTLSGNPVAMAAGLATLELVAQEGFYAHLERKMERVAVPIEEEIQRRDLPLCLNRVGSMGTLFFGPKSVASKADLQALDLEMFKRFFHWMFERGVSLPPSQYEAWFISSAHTDAHLDGFVNKIIDFLKIL
jgi:glutamate-1-semialdehyde 2,1-aminomutase